jgi:putative PIN family toxin of toxin-antitoxin system
MTSRGWSQRRGAIGSRSDVVRVTADTHILVAGLTFPESDPHTLLELARAGAIDLAFSDVILDQLADVLVRKFEWPDPDVQEARRQFGLFARRVVPTEVVHAVADDPDDNAILECTVAAGSEYIVSGDRHLLQLGAFRSIRVLKVADFLEVLRQRTGRAL